MRARWAELVRRSGLLGRPLEGMIVRAREQCRRCFVEKGEVKVDGWYYCLLCMKILQEERREDVKERMEELRDE